jgi:hypothetical protein
MLYALALALIIAWVGLAWLGGVLAWNRGRSRWLGIAIALVLPVIGLAIVYVLPPNDEQMILRRAAREQHDQVQESEALEERDAAHRRSAEGPRRLGREGRRGGAR